MVFARPSGVGTVRAGARVARLVGVTIVEHRALVGIVVVGAALRIGWVLALEPFTPVGEMADGDQRRYLAHGRDLAEGRGYVNAETGEPTAYYPIGYPAMLAVLFWLTGHLPLKDNDLVAAQALNVALGTGTIVFGYVLADRLFGRRGGLVAAALIAIFPGLVFQAGTAQVESAFTVAYLAALCVLVTHDWTSGLPSARRLALFGILLSASVVIRPFSLWFLVGVFLSILVARGGWRRAAVATLVPLAVVVATSIPWTVRNAVAMDAFIPTSSNIGDTLCLDRGDGADGGFRFSDHEGCADPTEPEATRSSESTGKAIRYVLDDPARELVQIGRRARLMVASDREGVQFVNRLGKGEVMAPSTIRTYGDIANRYFWVVLALAPIGIVVAVASRRSRPELVLTLTALASLVAVPLLLWGAPRFHIPFSPLLAVFAAGAIAGAIDAVSTARSASGGRAGG